MGINLVCTYTLLNMYIDVFIYVMPLNPCKNNWELCLGKELGIIGMQNKNIALETGGGFPAQPLQLNVCQ